MNETIVLGGGCFWCIEAIFKRLKGVESVTSGYAGGNIINPNYIIVSTGKSGYAEVIKIDFNPATITFDQLLKVFFRLHDPTTPNRQGNDIGPQYRSVIFYTSEKQRESAANYIATLNQQKIYKNPVVTEIIKLTKFYTAEEHHSNYFDNNPYRPYCRLVIAPKINHLETEFSSLLINISDIKK
jgi:peptide-methionine (S)-S-oxide reductase